jgi:serine/threonine protein kinase
MLRSNSLIATKILATCPQPIDKNDFLEGSFVPEEALSSDDVEGSFLHSDDDTIVQEINRIPVTSIPCAVNNAEFSEKETVPSISLATTFEILSTLGKGNFADVYRVRSKIDGRLYAVKRNRRRFRGRRDRDAAMSEVRCMQRLQANLRQNEQCNNYTDYSMYLLSFVQAWQEDGHFFCQTELCCRDTCREMMDSLRSNFATAKLLYPVVNRLAQTQLMNKSHDIQGCLMPEEVIWKVCHDICAGLSHIHANNLVHNDIKPSNILFFKHRNFGALCKIGDFGMTRNAGSKEDGQEGDQKYMARELLQSGIANPTGDIFSLGLTLYEMASTLSFSVPSDGPRWHEVRSGLDKLEISTSRSPMLIQLIQLMIAPDALKRPSAATVLTQDTVRVAGSSLCVFIRDYIQAVEDFDKKQEEKALRALHFDQTPRTGTRQICSPPLVELPPNLISNLCSPDFAS